MQLNTMKVVNIYGQEVEILVDSKKVYDFNNKKKEVTYNAKSVKNGEVTQFWETYIEEGVVTDLETKVKAFGNPFALLYAVAVDFNRSKNDPDDEIWNAMFSRLQANEKHFFTKEGDWKQRISADKQGLIIEGE